MIQYQNSQTNKTINFRLIVVDGIYIALESTKISRVTSVPALKKHPVMPYFVLGVDPTLNVPVIDFFLLYKLKWPSVSHPLVYVKAQIYADTEKKKKLEFAFFANEYLDAFDIDIDMIKIFGDEPNDISGIVKIGQRTVCILDLENIFSKDHLRALGAYMILNDRLN